MNSLEPDGCESDTGRGVQGYVRYSRRVKHSDTPMTGLSWYFVLASGLLRNLRAPFPFTLDFSVYPHLAYRSFSVFLSPSNPVQSVAHRPSSESTPDLYTDWQFFVKIRKVSNSPILTGVRHGLLLRR